MKDLCKPANDPVNIEIRRYQNRLSVTGAGVMVFGVWSIIKTGIVAAFTSNSAFRQAFADIRMQDFTHAETVATYILSSVFILLFIGAALLFRFKIYSSARKESRGVLLKRKNLYLVLSALMVMAGLFSLAMIPLNMRNENYTIYDAIVSIVVELTSIATLMELIHSAVKIRKLRAASE